MKKLFFLSVALLCVLSSSFITAMSGRLANEPLEEDWRYMPTDKPIYFEEKEEELTSGLANKPLYGEDLTKPIFYKESQEEDEDSDFDDDFFTQDFRDSEFFE